MYMPPEQHAAPVPAHTHCVWMRASECKCVSLFVLCVLRHPLKHAERLCNVLSNPIYLLHLASLP